MSIPGAPASQQPAASGQRAPEPWACSRTLPEQPPPMTVPQAVSAGEGGQRSPNECFFGGCLCGQRLLAQHAVRPRATADEMVATAANISNAQPLAVPGRHDDARLCSTARSAASKQPLCSYTHNVQFHAPRPATRQGRPRPPPGGVLLHTIAPADSHAPCLFLDPDAAPRFDALLLATALRTCMRTLHLRSHLTITVRGARSETAFVKPHWFCPFHRPNDKENQQTLRELGFQLLPQPLALLLKPPS